MPQAYGQDLPPLARRLRSDAGGRYDKSEDFKASSARYATGPARHQAAAGFRGRIERTGDERAGPLGERTGEGPERASGRGRPAGARSPIPGRSGFDGRGRNSVHQARHPKLRAYPRTTESDASGPEHGPTRVEHS